MTLDRINAEMILGARVWIVETGTKIGTTPQNTVSDTYMPDPPESYETPGSWVSLGKIRTAKPQTDYKTSDVEGVDDSGAYKVTELKLASKRKIQFTTNDITPEAFRMTFGLKEAIADGEEVPVFESGNDSMEVWMCFEFTDAYRNETGLARMFLRGKLSLQNPLEAKSDPAQADYELSVVPNPLAVFESSNLAGVAAG